MPLRNHSIVALLALLLVVAGCYSRAAPVVIENPPTPINMTARELYLGYDGSSRVIPASYDSWGDMIWVSGGSVVKPGTTYVLPVPTDEGRPTAELVEATLQPDGDLQLGTAKIALSADQGENIEVVLGGTGYALVPEITERQIGRGVYSRSVATVAEDTTYNLAEVKFWQVKVDIDKLPDDKLVVLHCFWQVYDVSGQPLIFHQYYRLER